MGAPCSLNQNCNWIFLSGELTVVLVWAKMPCPVMNTITAMKNFLKSIAIGLERKSNKLMCINYTLIYLS